MLNLPSYMIAKSLAKAKSLRVYLRSQIQGNKLATDPARE